MSAREQVDDLVVRLVAGTADSDIAPQLGELGIGYLWVTGAGEDVTSRIDNTPGLGTASGNEQGTVWQLQPAVAPGRAGRRGRRRWRSAGPPVDRTGRRRRPAAADR